MNLILFTVLHTRTIDKRPYPYNTLQIHELQIFGAFLFRLCALNQNLLYKTRNKSKPTPTYLPYHMELGEITGYKASIKWYGKYYENSTVLIESFQFKSQLISFEIAFTAS